MGSGVSIIEAAIGEAQDGLRLDRALADLLPDLSRERLKALIGAGRHFSRSARTSSHMAFSTASVTAKPRPRTQEKYHMDAS